MPGNQGGGGGVEAENHGHRTSLVELEGNSRDPNKGLPLGKAPRSASWRKAEEQKKSLYKIRSTGLKKTYLNYPREKPSKEYESYEKSGEVITIK